MLTMLFLAATLAQAEGYVRSYAVKANITDPIFVVQTSQSWCPGTPTQTCRAWVVWSGPGWIVAFTPYGLELGEGATEYSAAHEIAHILHDADELRGGSPIESEDKAHKQAVEWIAELHKVKKQKR